MENLDGEFSNFLNYKSIFAKCSEFGIKTNLDELHEYQNRIENSDCDVINDFSYNSAGLIKTKE